MREKLHGLPGPGGGGQWIGDVSVQVPQVFLALDRRADALVEKAIRDFIFLRKGAVLVGNVPGIHFSELPAQSLCAISEVGMLAEYWRYTGNKPLLSAAFEPMVAYLKCWETDERGLVRERSGNWGWHDHLFNVDAPVLENTWYASALRFALSMAEALDDHRFDVFLRDRLQGIEASFHGAFWQGHGYGATPMMDERANAMAVLSGLAGRETWPAIHRVLIAVQSCTPYMERFRSGGIVPDGVTSMMRCAACACGTRKWPTVRKARFGRIFISSERKTMPGPAPR